MSIDQTLVAEDVDPVLNPRDQVVDGQVVGARLQGHVGHPLDRHVVRGVGVRTAVGPGHTQPRREHPVKLVADEEAVAHQIPPLRLHTLVVPTDTGQPEILGAVGGHVHHRRSVPHRAQLVRCRERRARVGGLVADCAVVFGGVPDGFVNRQPQVGRVDDEVGRPRCHARCLDLLREQRRQLCELGRPVPHVVTLDGLPAPSRSGARACAWSRRIRPRSRRRRPPAPAGPAPAVG